MDVSRAQLSNVGDGVILVDPEWPYRVRVQLELDSEGRPTAAIAAMAVSTVSDGPPITATVLSQIPIRQIASVAASALAGEGEAQYRMLARPRPKGVRSWPPDHFERVGRVVAWARRTQRPGGVAGAVSEFWGVHPRTARRWISRL